jgi:hypothetical protein
MAVKPYHQGTHRRRAEKVCKAAYADPLTLCWRCMRTLAQHKPGDKWTAGHVIDATSDTLLLPEAASCNFSAGITRENQRRKDAKQRSAMWG